MTKNMNKKNIITMLLAIFCMTAMAKEKNITWENPATEYGSNYGDGYFYLALDVTKVELKTDETVVYITAKVRSDNNHSFQFVGNTYLKADDRRYPLISADGIELNKFVQTNKDGKRDMVFHFRPLPMGTKSFDFIEGDTDGAFQIKGIKPVEERWKQLFPSYWRDGQGDWKIAFFDDCVIYDCKFWNYEQCQVNKKTGEADIVMRNGKDVLKVVVGKDKNGQRTIQIGNRKAVYEMITSRFMPDYPTKDTRTDFVDTGNKIDTVTVTGWIKDMPEPLKRLKTFEFNYGNIYTSEQESVHADLDDQGRFTVKIPVLNSTEFFCDWNRCFVLTMLEPGKNYFLLFDYKEGRRYFMGEDCRLQNELIKYHSNWQPASLEPGEDFDRFIASADSQIKSQYAKIDALCEAHPMLSTRFNHYRKGYILWNQACFFGLARFHTQDFQLTDNARKYAYDTFWTKKEKPYTLYRDFCVFFLNDYLDDASRAYSASFFYNPSDHYKEYASNDKELAILERWNKWLNEVAPIIEAEPTLEAQVHKSEELNAKNSDLIKEADKILKSPKGLKIMHSGLLVNTIKGHLMMLESLNADPFIKNIWLTRQALHIFDYQRSSLLPYAMDTLKALIDDSLCIEKIEKQNDHYLAIENREFDRLVLKSSDDLKDISEGETLMKKIIEPYKGKFVLLDIWGTWCGPCKEALSHSTEEYARLKDIDIQYLYLANQSPQDSYENVIKEYNISGPNVAHYNLPDEQQNAIERYLNVNKFPTYILFDRNGNQLDLQVDPRDLEGLAHLLEQLSK